MLEAHNKQYPFGWHALTIAATVLAVTGAMFLSGCGGGGGAGPAGLPPGVSGPGGKAPVSGAPIARRPKKSGAKDTKGVKIALAEEIVLAKTNPFLSKLPKINVNINLGTNTPANVGTQTAIDPFAGLTLLGIVFNPDKAIALVSMGGGATALLSKGDTFSGGASELKIGKISRDSVEVTTSTGEKTQLFLPDIIGYQSGGLGTGNFDSQQPRERTIVDKLNDIIDGSGPLNTPRGGLNLQEP